MKPVSGAVSRFQKCYKETAAWSHSQTSYAHKDVMGSGENTPPAPLYHHHHHYQALKTQAERKCNEGKFEREATNGQGGV